MIESLLLLLILLQVKHWYVDFVDQTDEEVQWKGTYLDWRGVKHSVKHGMATALCFLVVAGWSNLGYAILMGCIDIILHYHIDWTKMNYGNRDIRTPQFWNHLGLDQMAHQICYILLVWMTFQ